MLGQTKGSPIYTNQIKGFKMNNNILIEKLLSTDFKGSADYISGARDGMYTLDRNLPSPTGDRDCEELKERVSELEKGLKEAIKLLNDCMLNFEAKELEQLLNL